MRRARRGRLWLTVLAAASLAALAAAAAAASLLPGAGDAGPARAASPAPSSAAPPRGSRVPRVPPASVPGLRWTSYHGVELPSSPQAGPRDTAGGLASGFADTPPGALLAAVNIAVRANAQWGPGIYGPTIGGQVTGPDAAALLAACQAAYAPAARAAGITGGQPLGSAYVTEEAFRWVAYTASDATVDIVSAGPGSQGLTARAVTRIQVTWDGSDWKVVAPPGGDWSSDASVLASLAGYTVFPGQG